MPIKSNNLFVFPCVSREARFDLDAKVLSEKNITNIIKSVTDKESYIISWDNNSNLRCVIRGYYFEIKGESKPTAGSTTSRYVHLVMKGDPTDPVDPDRFLIKGDNGVDFEGLTIDSNSSEADLILYENGIIPESSFIKFDRSSLPITTIDCGELK